MLLQLRVKCITLRCTEPTYVCHAEGMLRIACVEGFHNHSPTYPG